MGQDERHKANQKTSRFSTQKSCKMKKKNYMRIPIGKAGKTLIVEVSRLIGLFNGNKRWEPVAIHTLQVFLPLLLPKPSLKSKKQRTCQIPEQTNGTVETRKARRTDLRV